MDTKERRPAFYQCSTASADLAQLAVGLAEALAEVTDSSFTALSERLRITRRPQIEGDVLADIFLEALGEIASTLVVVVDDYQSITTEVAAEEFVERVLVSSGVRTVLASRVRPRWATARRLLYGELTEIDARQLAMTQAEAEAVFDAMPFGMPLDLMARADGWPAVISLSALAGKAELDGTGPLEQFLAEEVCRCFDDEIADALAVIGSLPSIRRQMAHDLLGVELADRSIGAAIEAGLLTELTRETYELHPLIGEFLASRTLSSFDQTLEHRIIAHCLQSGEWDALFHFSARLRSQSLLEALFADGVQHALEQGRSASVQRWVSYARVNRIAIDELPLAEAELALRDGLYLQAETLALGAVESAQSQGRPQGWGLSIAGRAAHLAGREQQAVDYYRRARGCATSDRERREAELGELKSAIDLELPAASQVLDRLRKSYPSNPTDQVELSARALMLGARLGTLHAIEEARITKQLLPNVADPLIRTSFRNTFAYACAVAGEYEDALSVLDDLEEDAREHRLTFTIAYVHLGRAVVAIAQRRFDEGFERLTGATNEARRTNDVHVIASCAATRARALVALGRFDEARAVAAHDHPELIASMRAELLSAQALAMACAGQHAQATTLVDRAAAMSGAVEVPVTAACVKAIHAGRSQADDADRRAAEAAAVARRCWYVDGLIVAYRGFPELARRIARNDESRSWFAALLRRAGDDALAQVAGLGAGAGPQCLSRREAEVFDLLRLGMTNKQIASKLFISEGTAKVHVHHILEKLGAKTRTQAVLMAPPIN
jgi:ATP/maltotriose-dependent transcriptional regulator MalT